MKTAVLRYLFAALSLVAIATLGASPAAAAVTYLVTLDTSSVNGTSGFIDFQFNPGNATSQLATVQIQGFTGATVTPPAPIVSCAPLAQSTVCGNVTGDLPGTVTLVNSTSFNELFRSVNFGTSITFVVSLSGPAIDSPNGTATAGSTFSISLYDAAINSILTDQASGAAGQVDINLNGSVTATAFPAGRVLPSIVTFAQLLDSYSLTYMSNLNLTDSVINVTNAGSRAGTDPAGTICANLYAFDPAEEMISCCSCMITPNGLKAFSARQDLLSNVLTPGSPTSITVALIATAPTGGTCNASQVATNGSNMVTGLRAWGTTAHPAANGVGVAVTENEFRQAQLSPSELIKLQGYCSMIQVNGSGYGQCKSCRATGLGADSK